MFDRELYKGKTYNKYIKDELDEAYNTKKVSEYARNRIISSLSSNSDTKLAIIGTCSSSLDKTTELRGETLGLKCRYCHIVARWTNEKNEQIDESGMIIYGISLKDALRLGTKYSQDSVIYKDQNGLKRISTGLNNDYVIGHVIAEYDNSRDALENDLEQIILNKKQRNNCQVYLIDTGNVLSISRYEPILTRII
ncbi:MAG: hypothetical protein IJF94_03745 [Eubacterium sp.]|nr:hypothetical protein [Eubacterium sp.]